MTARRRVEHRPDDEWVSINRFAAKFCDMAPDAFREWMATLPGDTFHSYQRRDRRSGRFVWNASALVRDWAELFPEADH
ncbi:hypothetical protein [Streptomyces sp. NPDC096153]|uniref:hypothetical protein n=1 Tax=Streptomyces sp. NPDC096153 TaxID=3155548 RepID=UPI00332B64AB